MSVKQILITLSEEDHKRAKEYKDTHRLTWHQLLLSVISNPTQSKPPEQEIDLSPEAIKRREESIKKIQEGRTKEE